MLEGQFFKYCFFDINCKFWKNLVFLCISYLLEGIRSNSVLKCIVKKMYRLKIYLGKKFNCVKGRVSFFQFYRVLGCVIILVFFYGDVYECGFYKEGLKVLVFRYFFIDFLSSRIGRFDL